jgi:hypothetical protein
MNGIEKRLSRTPASRRVLLLPHCLRRVDTCRAKYGDDGLVCLHCNVECPINILTRAAKDAGYGAICVAPGGSLALKFVLRNNPVGIVAVACDKELREGIEAVKSSAARGGMAIVVIPLSRDGCLNTEVEIPSALASIWLGLDHGGVP